MDYYSFCLDAFSLAGQSMIHILFISRFTGKKQKVWHIVIYFFLLCMLEWLAGRFAITGLSGIGAFIELLILCGMSRFLLGNSGTLSWVAAVLAIYITQFSFGIINSAEAMAFPGLIGKPLLYPMLFLATLAAFAISAGSYKLVLKFLSLAEDSQTPYIGLLLFPGLFFFTAEQYILHTSYHIPPSTLSLAEAGKHTALLFLQILGLGALLCTLYAYRRICWGFQAQAALSSLSQASQAQKIYIAEAQLRYEQTKAFRHDIKNHLSVLDGLLKNGRLEEGRAYLERLEITSSGLSFPYHTGNTVVDILLGEKLSLAEAEGIMVELSLLLPESCGIDDFDLCVIVANALDNAIHACQSVEGDKIIRITGERQGDFYLLTFENACSSKALPPAGIGLTNIRTVAEKYHGAMLTEKADLRFSLHVLLNISLHPESISGRKP